MKSVRRHATLIKVLIFAVCSIASAGAVAEESSEHGSTHEWHANEVGLLVAMAFERRENGVSLGAEYVRRFNELLGVGVLADRTWGDLDFWVYAIPFRLHVDRWRFTVAPGVERSHGHTENLVRLSAAYAFPLKSSSFATGIGIDFVDGEQVYLVGASIGFGF